MGNFELDKADVLNSISGRYADFYRQYTTLKPSGGKWRGPCPLHDGNAPNFEVDTTTGKWHCYSECDAGGDVFDFLSRKDGISFPDALAAIKGWAGAPARAVPSGGNDQKAARRIVATYDYTDESGLVLFQAIRYEPKSFTQRRPDGSGGWVNDLKGVRRVLYRLPEMVAAVRGGKPVYLVEGEKDVDTLRALGLVATCNPLGAGKWSPDYTKSLHGADVVIVPDNDQKGHDHAESVAIALKPVVKRVRKLELPGIAPKADISDWLAAGGTCEELKRLSDTAPDWTHQGTGAAAQPGAITAGTYIRKPLRDRLIDLADVPPPSAELPYLWGPYILKGCTHWLTGKTGLGKSTFAFNIACALADGRGLWGIDCAPHKVIYLDMESGDDGRSRKVDRLYGEDARTRERLWFMREPIKLPDEQDDLVRLSQDLDISLVIFDTARRCFSVKDENDNAEVYNRIIPTLDALKAVGIASLTMGHPPKNGGFGARGAGAQEDAGDVNLTLTMHQGEVNDPNGIVALQITKNRLLGLEQAPLYLKRVGHDQFEQVFVQAARSEAQTHGNKPEGARDRCRLDIMTFIETHPDGRALHGELMKAMTAKQHSESTFKRALKKLQEEGEIERASDGAYALPGDMHGLEVDEEGS